LLCRALGDPWAADRRDPNGLGLDLGRPGHRRRRRTARRGVPVAAGAWPGDPRRDVPPGRGRRADAGRRAGDPGPQLRGHLRPAARRPGRPGRRPRPGLRRAPQPGPVLGLRGAGAGNFGVVTSLLFGTVPAPQVTNFHLTWPPAHAAALIEAWQGWAPLAPDEPGKGWPPPAPDELYASWKLTAADEVDQPASLDVYGALLGSESDATRLLDALVVRAGADPPWGWVEQLSFAETRRFWAELPVGKAGGGQAARAPAAQPPYLAAK